MFQNQKLNDPEDPAYDPSPTIRLECRLLHPDAVIPTKKRFTDVGYDVSSIADYTLESYSTLSVDTGIALSAPPGFYYTVDGRSSLWSKGILPFRGIIDATYTGPLIVGLFNMTPKPYHIKKGDRIAQLILSPIIHLDIATVEEFSNRYNQRGAAGFGSSGR
jgi:dUTP pyrophosphatase